MRVFIIELDDIEDSIEGGMDALMQYVISKKFEYWKYFSHQLTLATPDEFDSAYILNMVVKYLGGDVQVSVFEVSMNSYVGYGPSDFMAFFNLLKHPKYIPVWERKGENPYDISNILEMEGVPKSLKRRIMNS